MPIEVELPDGNIAEFPDGMPAADIQNVLRRQFTEPRRASVGGGESAFRGGMQGATLGFADEAMGAIGGLYAKLMRPDLFEGKGAGDMYREGRDTARSMDKAAAEDNPLAYYGSMVAGGVATAPLMPAVAPLKGANAGSRIFNAVTTGSAYGAGAGLGHSEADVTKGEIEQAAKDTGVGALIGGATGGALQGAVEGVSSAARGVKNAWKGFNAREAEALSETQSALKAKASGSYQAMRDAGVEISPKAMQRISHKVHNAVRMTGKLNEKIHTKTLAALDDIKTAAKSGKLSLEELDQYRQLLRDAALGRDADAFKAGRAIDALDDAIESLGGKDVTGNIKGVKYLQNARTEWARGKKFDAIAEIVERAEGDPNRIKALLKTFANNKKRTRGFSKDEIALLKQASRYTAPEAVLKMLGKFGIDLGTSLTAGNTALPAAATWMTGNPLPIIAGTAARQGQKYLARGKAENLLRAIEGKGAPMSAPPQIPAFIAALERIGGQPITATALENKMPYGQSR